MSKLFIICTTILWTMSAKATTQVIFSIEKAIILVQGQPGDLDAPNLYNAINLPASDDGTSLRKTVHITDAKDKLVLSIDCRISKTITDYGSCTITVPKSESATIDKDKRQILFMTGLPGSATAAKAFNADQSGRVFISTDSHLGLMLDYSGTGTPMSFRLFYI